MFSSPIAGWYSVELNATVVVITMSKMAPAGNVPKFQCQLCEVTPKN